MYWHWGEKKDYVLTWLTQTWMVTWVLILFGLSYRGKKVLNAKLINSAKEHANISESLKKKKLQILHALQNRYIAMLPNENIAEWKGHCINSIFHNKRKISPICPREAIFKRSETSATSKHNWGFGGSNTYQFFFFFLNNVKETCLAHY